MHTSPEVVPVLSVSPIAEDHCALQDILRHESPIHRAFVHHAGRRASQDVSD